jgi:hypothetical protein
MPVANDRGQENECSDNQPSSSFQRVNVLAGPALVVPFRLRADRHGNIVVLRVLNYAALLHALASY